MTDEQFIKWVERSGNLCVLDYAKKLVERGGGSGAIACCADAERSTQAGAEESRENSPGCAGEAGHEWKPAAKDGFTEAIRPLFFYMLDHGLERMEITRDGYIVKSWMHREAQPDSEARNERSGRRNQGEQP